jgi:hypothetical protein
MLRLEALQRTDFSISGYETCHGWVEVQRFGVPLSPPSRYVERKRQSLTYLHNTLSLSVQSCSRHVGLTHCEEVEAVPVHMNPEDGDKAGSRNVGLRRRYNATESPKRFMDHSLLYMLIRGVSSLTNSLVSSNKDG